jgi:rSAM/selenodomain-associated transferase 2
MLASVALSRPTVAILIPTLDEEENLRRNLPAALAAADRVVVSDGGSRDGTVAVARELGAEVVEGPPGRGRQLNLAAKAAGAAPDVLVFLHADTTLPEGGVEAIRRVVSEGARHGAFYLRFDSSRRRQRLGAALINLRTRVTRAPLGDQAQWVTRELFREVGGFRDWPILEDLDLARRLKRTGRGALLEGPVVTSARRFERRGTVRTVTVNWLIWLLYFAGVPPRRLARLYRHVR